MVDTVSPQVVLCKVGGVTTFIALDANDLCKVIKKTFDDHTAPQPFVEFASGYLARLRSGEVGPLVF